MSNEYNSKRESDAAWGTMPDPDPIYQGQPPYTQQPPYGQYGYSYPNPFGQYTYGGPVPPVAMMQKASFGQRIASWLVDGILVYGAAMLLIIFVTFVGLFFIGPSERRHSDLGEALGSLVIIFGYLGTMILCAVYFAVSIARGQTVGNRVAGMRFVDANGQPPGAGKSLVRLLMQMFVSGWFLFGYLWMLWDPEQQTLHDKVAGTYGVTINRY